MKDFDMMLDELLDMHPEAVKEVAALRSKVSAEGGKMEAEGEEMMMEGEEMEEGSMPFKPIPADLADEEEAEEDEEEMY